MSTRAYSEINLHFTWHVKASLPIIAAEIEPRLHRYIKSYALQTKGLIFHEIGGTETHVTSRSRFPQHCQSANGSAN